MRKQHKEELEETESKPRTQSPHLKHIGEGYILQSQIRQGHPTQAELDADADAQKGKKK